MAHTEYTIRAADLIHLMDETPAVVDTRRSKMITARPVLIELAISCRNPPEKMQVTHHFLDIDTNDGEEQRGNSKIRERKDMGIRHFSVIEECRYSSLFRATWEIIDDCDGLAYVCT